MSDLHAKMVAQCFTADEAIHFLMNIPCSGDESDKENMHGDKRGGVANVNPDHDSNYPE